MSIKRKRIGLMGCGVVADYGHIPAILDTPELCLQSLFDPNLERVAYMRLKVADIARSATDEAI